MRRLLPVCIIALVVAGACTEAVEITTTTAEADPGRLAVVDGEGNIVVMAPDGSGRVEVTSDGGTDAVYSQPIWSPDGSSLAWGQATAAGFALGFAEVGGAVAAVTMSSLPFYAFWSPDGARLGALHNGADGLDLEMVEASSATATVIDSGSPYYFSWSPDSDELITHVGANGFQRLTVAGTATPAGPTDQGYLAPQWTDRGWWHVVDGALVLADESASEPVARVGELTMFVSNAQATRMALQSTDGGQGISVGLVQEETAPRDAVVVVDVETGEIEVASSQSSVGFFWSPDGEALLILTPSPGMLEPSVWTSAGGTVDYPGFIPSEDLVTQLLPFFPQYAQSMTLWSPASSVFAYPSSDGIWTQELDAEAPVRVTDGTWVAWSP